MINKFSKLFISVIFITTIMFGFGINTFAKGEELRLENAIEWMFYNGLTIYNDGMAFQSDRGLRRDEAAKFFVNFSKLIGKTNYIKTDSECKFSDLNQSRSDLKSIVVESCKLGLFQGNKGMFNPEKSITNEQSIAVLVRLIDGYKDEKSTNSRSDNYYKKANELNILNYVSMDNRKDIATRGNVGVIVYEGNDAMSNKSDLILESVSLDDRYPLPKVDDEKVYLKFRITNIGEPITFSTGTKAILSCESNTGILKIEITDFSLDINTTRTVFGSNNTDKNTYLFPNADNNYKINCSLLLYSRDIEEITNSNNYKSLSFSVMKRGETTETGILIQIDDVFQKDETFVYLNHNKLAYTGEDSIDAKTFERIGKGYFKDKDKIYYYHPFAGFNIFDGFDINGNKIEYININNFKLIGDPNVYDATAIYDATDGNMKFKNGVLVE